MYTSRKYYAKHEKKKYKMCKKTVLTEYISGIYNLWTKNIITSIISLFDWTPSLFLQHATHHKHMRLSHSYTLTLPFKNMCKCKVY